MKTNRVATVVLVILLGLVVLPAILLARDDGTGGRTASLLTVVRQDAKPQSVTPSGTAPPSGLADLESRADLQMARKEYAEAAKTYKSLLVQAPGNAVYLNKLGIAYHQQQMLSVAQRFYEKAVKADPHYADAFNNIGTIYYQKKKYGKAVRFYKKALQIREDMPAVYCNLGYAYFSEKHYPEAMDAFQRAVQLDPTVFEHSSRTGSVLQDRSVGDRGMFYFLLAKSYAQMGNAERCAYYLHKARDEGYSSMAKVKDDPAFAAVLRDPGVQEALQAAGEKKP
ncbi:MAG TPA: tetratricopeptide repeat protein [Candidatus Acidoferrales bacterium]|nr:tetratricopeptide repeat protein [Candidatus Acidoferrales bacterium]